MPTKISGTLRVTGEARAAQILDVHVPRTKYLPGETIKAFVTFRPFRGAETTMPVEMEIPVDLPDGTYSLSLSDWQTYLSDEQTSEPFRFRTENIDQVFAVLSAKRWCGGRPYGDAAVALVAPAGDARRRSEQYDCVCQFKR
jgi:hypothetical protein